MSPSPSPDEEEIAEIERALLRSARLDPLRLPRGTRHKIFASMVAASGLAATHGVTAAAAASAIARGPVQWGALAIVKWATIGAAAGAVALGATGQLDLGGAHSRPPPVVVGAATSNAPPRPAREQRGESSAVSLAAREPAVTASNARDATARPEEIPAVAASNTRDGAARPEEPPARPKAPPSTFRRAERPAPPLAAPAPEVTPPFPLETSMAAPRVTATPPATSLAIEVTLLEQARAALAAHDADKAIGALDEYQRRFPRGHLVPEASFLRVRCLVARGDHVAARQLAAQLLAADPRLPKAAELRAIMSDGP